MYWLVDLDAPSPEWGLLLGDFLTNVRAALDHLAWQLPALESKSPERGTSFPICDVRPKGGEPKIVNVTDRAVLDAVIACQPYIAEAKYGHPVHTTGLHCLRELVNLDKHKLLLTGVHALDLRGIWWGLDEGYEPNWGIHGGPIKEAQPIARFDFGEKRVPEDFEPHLDLTVRIENAPPGLCQTSPLLDLVEMIYFAVEHEVLGEHLAPFFGLSYRYQTAFSE